MLDALECAVLRSRRNLMRMSPTYAPASTASAPSALLTAPTVPAAHTAHTAHTQPRLPELPGHSPRPLLPLPGPGRPEQPGRRRFRSLALGMSLSLLPLSATGPPLGPAAAVIAPMEHASSFDSPSDSPSALPTGTGVEKSGNSGESGDSREFENSEKVKEPRESAESKAPRTDAPRASYGWPTGSPARVVRGFDPPTVIWGSGHRGVDLSLQAGSPVLAAGDGTVAFAGVVAGRPVVSIDHADGIRTTYEPVEASVTAGDVVTRGQTIGTLLAGHRSDGVDALHWGARTGPKSYINPLRLLHPAVVRLKPLRSERSEQNQPG